MNADERDQLIDSLLDSEISEADFLRLEAEMHVDPAARQAYYERLKLDTNLLIEAEAAGGGDGKKASVGIAPGPPLKFGWLGWMAAMALALLTGAIGWKIGQDREAVTTRKEEPVASGFGVVAEQSNAGWSINRGDLIPEGPIQLKSGIVQLDLFSGVTLIVEGAAEFEVLSTMELSVTRGNVRARVPGLARGFRVRIPTGELVDLGTEFSIDVTPEYADLRVMEGQVEWHPVAKPMSVLQEGESLRWTAAGEVGTIGDSPAHFGELERRMAEQRKERREVWADASQKMRNDPRLLAYFPMDQTGTWNRQVFDESPARRNGTIVRASRVEGRFAGKSGLDFTPTGSRIRLEVPGDHESLSLMCWVKIDSLDRWYNSLFLTDGHELFEPHWQIMDDGRLFFSVKANEVDKKKHFIDKHIAFSPPIWTPAQSGKWMHIATVFDGQSMTTTHYLNGEAISRDEIPENLQPEKVRIGAASIGNWSDPTRGNDPHFAVRNLNGVIDEFAIFSASLSDKEIREIYESGKP